MPDCSGIGCVWGGGAWVCSEANARMIGGGGEFQFGGPFFGVDVVHRKLEITQAKETFVINSLPGMY